ncbi:MAG: hypothetical protein ACRC2V_17975, partial [Xenococcaceae cyanobacterium]
ELTPEQLAADENTSPEILRELASSSDPLVLENLVMNSNIPPDILVKLAPEFPRQLFKNPAIDLLLLEIPDLISGGLADLLSSLLKRERSVFALECAAISQDKRIQLALLMNQNTPKEVLERFVLSKDEDIAEAAKLHINWEENSDRDREDFAKHKIQSFLDNSDKNIGNIVREVAIELKSDLDLESALGYVNLNDVPAYISCLIENYDRLNPCQAIIYQQEQRALYGQLKDEAKAAIDPNTPAHILENFAKSGQFLTELACNPNTPVSIIETLIKDLKSLMSESVYVERETYREIKKIIITNPSTPEYLIEELIESDCDYSVDEAIASNLNISITLLEKLVKKLLKRASNNKASLEREIIGKIINNPNTPLLLIEELFEFNYNDESIYEALASNYNITSSLLEKLAQKLLDRFTKNCHSKLDALIAVVNNPKISSNLRKTIVDKL